MVLEICKWVYVAIALYFAFKTGQENTELQKTMHLAIVMLALILATLVMVLQKL